MFDSICSTIFSAFTTLALLLAPLLLTVCLIDVYELRQHNLWRQRIATRDHQHY